LQRTSNTKNEKQPKQEESVQQPQDHRGRKEIQGNRHRHDNDRPRDEHQSGSTLSWITDELIADTISTWQPFYPHRLTEADAIEILQGVGRLYDIMEQFDD
jgi:hypothetical protein